MGPFIDLILGEILYAGIRENTYLDTDALILCC
jgi:hypothetical protein